MSLSLSAALLVLGAAAQDDVAALEQHRCPKPAEFAVVFSMGYGGDDLPKEDDRFEDLLKRIKAGHFNVIHCTYTDKRLELCRKHGIKMMVHLLHEEQHHVYKSPDKAKAVCEKLRGNPDVWGYNIWNDGFRKTGPGRRRDINTVRTWDPTHPAYSGTYRVDGMGHLVNADAIGYYDFHWKRGPHYLFPHLLAYSRWAKERDAYFYRWLEVDPGIPGKGNFNRALHSANTSIACGLKGILWFLGTSMIDPKTLEWTVIGQDIGKVNAEILPLAAEINRLGNPVAIYSTPVTRTLKNDPVEKPGLPPGLEQNAFPADSPLQPIGGEFVLGLFRDPEGQEAAFIANHNAYLAQEVRLRVGPRPVELFDRKAGKWKAAPTQDGVVTFTLDEAAGALLRFGK